MTSDDNVHEHNTLRPVWVDHFLDREQQPMTLPPFADTIASQLLH